jgi:hypothetical protein
MHVGGFDERSGKRLIESVDTGETSILKCDEHGRRSHTDLSKTNTDKIQWPECMKYE